MADAAKAFAFGPFCLVPERRILAAEGREVPIRGRAFDLLLALVERRDRVVSKDGLMELVWPDRVVEEGNLTVHVAGLRSFSAAASSRPCPGAATGSWRRRSRSRMTARGGPCPLPPFCRNPRRRRQWRPAAHPGRGICHAR